IQDTLQDIFHDVFDDTSIRISRDTTATDVEGWDSFNHVRMIVAVEEQFRISLSTAEVADLRNVGELIDLIGRHAANDK
ncbi:MAG TPA: acyl carrier protein, partial [Alphaproteobacteria bacterium]